MGVLATLTPADQTFGNTDRPPLPTTPTSPRRHRLASPPTAVICLHPSVFSKKSSRRPAESPKSSSVVASASPAVLLFDHPLQHTETNVEGSRARAARSSPPQWSPPARSREAAVDTGALLGRWTHSRSGKKTAAVVAGPSRWLGGVAADHSRHPCSTAGVLPLSWRRRRRVDGRRWWPDGRVVRLGWRLASLVTLGGRLLRQLLHLLDVVGEGVTEARPRLLWNGDGRPEVVLHL